MLKISHTGCLGLSPVILVQFTPKNTHRSLTSQKKSPKTPFWGSRSFKAIDVGIPKKLIRVLVMTISKSMPICNRSHTRRVNSIKYWFLAESTLFNTLILGKSAQLVVQNLATKN